MSMVFLITMLFFQSPVHEKITYRVKQNSRTRTPQCDYFYKISKKILHNTCPETRSFRHTRYRLMGQHTSQQCYLSWRYIKRNVSCTQDTAHRGLSCDPLITECTHDEHYHMLSTLGACNTPVGTAARECALRHLGNARYAILGMRATPSWSTSSRRQCVSTIGAVSPWDRLTYNAYGTCECRSPTDSTDTRQWRCYNYSCETRAVENLTRYSVIFETI
jgi:hypothetical protein